METTEEQPQIPILNGTLVGEDFYSIKSPVRQLQWIQGADKETLAVSTDSGEYLIYQTSNETDNKLCLVDQFSESGGTQSYEMDVLSVD